MTLPSAVAFFAHPDDETIMAGWLLAMSAEQGVAVQVICATHGEGGEMGEPPVVPQRELSETQTVRDSLRSVESVRRQWPEVDSAQPDDAFAALLLEVGAWIPRTKSDGD